MICKNCFKENENTNIRCEFCDTDLNNINDDSNFLNKDYTRQINIDSKHSGCFSYAIIIFILAPWFFVGLAFTVISGLSIISDYNNSKNYIKIQGNLVEFNSCRYDENQQELCNAIYEYNVDRITYKASPNRLSTKSEFSSTIIMKYNPNNPSEYIINPIDSGWLSIFIIGIITIIFVVIIFIAIKVKFKSLSSSIKNNVTYN